MNTKLLIQVGALSTIFACAMGNAVADDNGIKISTKGGLKVKTADGNAEFAAGGRIQWDYDKTEQGTTEEETFEVRRARLFFKGKVGDWGYKTQFNVGEDDGGSVEDLYIQYKGWGKKAVLTIGKHKEQFGLEEVTSSKDISLLERSAITEAFVPGRNAGVQISGKSDNRIFYAIGVYRDDATDDESIAETAVTGRIVFAPINEEGRVIHIGAAMRSGDLVDLTGLELAAVFGQFHAQFETIEADASGADVDGSYVQVGYIFNGNPRPYKGGKFKRVKSSNGTAIEVVARLEDGFGRYSDIGLTSAEGEQTALGINFYPNSNLRFGISFMDGELDGVTGVDGEEVRFRTQFTF